jgi:Ca-activated chloride channel family protein
MFDAVDWSRPEWLMGLMLVPVVIATIVWSFGRRRRALDAFSEAPVRGRTQPLPARRRQVRGVLLVLSLMALVLAVAGPRWGTERVAPLPVGQEVVFALDVSRSMLATDVEPSRLERAKLAIRQILATLPTAESGLAIFAGEAALVVPLTRDAAAIDLYLSSVGPDWVSDPSTDLGRALGSALDAFPPDNAPGRTVVLLSDGEDHSGGLESVARSARSRGIEINVIGIGTDDGSRIPAGTGRWVEDRGQPVISRLDREKLERVADETGGRFVALEEGDGELPSLIGRLQALDTGRSIGRESQRRADRYRWPLLIALIALGLETLLGFGAIGWRVKPATVMVAAVLVLAMGRASGPEEMYEEGRYSDALTAWRQIDRAADAKPEDAYNRGNAAYRLGEYREATASHAVAARTAGTRGRAAEAWYNSGNGRFRIAEEVDAANPDDSQRYWDSTVAAYREALLRDPEDIDAKHNLELALRRRDQAAGGGGGGGATGGGGGAGGGPGGGGRGMQPPSSGGAGSPRNMTRGEAERLLDALAAQEREALARGEGDEQARRSDRPAW